MGANANRRLQRLLIAAACLAAAAPACLAVAPKPSGGDNGVGPTLLNGLKHYEVVRPFDIRKAGRAGGDAPEADANNVRHPAGFSLSITAFGRDYHLQLTRHDTLLGDGYGEWSLGADGSVSKQQPADAHAEWDAAGLDAGQLGGQLGMGGHCYYQGRVVGEEGEEEEGSVVAVSICDGVRGQIFSRTRGTLSLEPAHRHVVGEAAPVPGPRGEPLVGR